MWLEALGLLVGGLLGATIFMAVDYFLSEDKLVEEVEEQYPDAFKLLIKEKKKNAYLRKNKKIYLQKKRKPLK